MARYSHCVSIIKEASGDLITDEQAKELIDAIVNRAKNTDAAQLASLEQRIAKAGDDLIAEMKVQGAIQKRNGLLAAKASKRINDYVHQFDTLGEGLDAFNNGSVRLKNRKGVDITGGRNSVDAQIVALRAEYVGQLQFDLEKAKLIREFRSDELADEVFTELYHIGNPDVNNPTGSKRALKMAQIIHNLQRKAVERLNRAGGYIRMADNYVMTQTHDAAAIRKAAGPEYYGTFGFKDGSSEASFTAWHDFILPLLDHEATFKGATNKAEFLRGAHEGILTGVHGKSGMPLMGEFTGTGTLARKVSQRRVLHFKDAESALLYNKRFGSRSIRDGILEDLKAMAHSTALMENYGPNPEVMFKRTIRKLKEEVRGQPDDLKQMKSLENEWLEGGFNQLTGQLDMPNNPTLQGVTRGILAHSTLSRLGQVTLSAIPDKAFFHAAGTYQGWSNMDAFAANLDIFSPKSPDDSVRLTMMDAAIDSFLGEVASRFASRDNTAGRMFKLQQAMFKINGMNWWNDIHKGTFAKHTANWLGVNAHLPFDVPIGAGPTKVIPDSLRKVLRLYGFDALHWDVLRKAAFKAENGHMYLTPDRVNGISDDVIGRLVKAGGDTDTANNIARYRDKLRSNLMAFITDQVDTAVPTPGNRERLIANWNSQSGTAKGSVIRMLMHFKSFPITVWERVIKRELFGRGTSGVGEWLLSEAKSNFRLTQLVAMTTVGGYISMAIKDALKGRTPKSLVNKDGSFNWEVLVSSAQRGGGLGIYGDLLFNEYDRSYKNALTTLAGPVFGQLPEVAAIGSSAVRGQKFAQPLKNLMVQNTPYINLFYVRPVLDYMILWQIQEMLSPGSVRKIERKIEKENNQSFFISPSEAVK